MMSAGVRDSIVHPGAPMIVMRIEAPLMSFVTAMPRVACTDIPGS